MKNLEKYLSILGDEVDGLLLTSRFSRHYGAEFDIAEGIAIVTKQGCRYFTDSRYIESAQNGIRGFEVIEMNRENPFSKLINEACADFGISTLGYEEEYLTVAEFMAYEQKLDFLTARDKCAAYVERYPTDEDGVKELAFLNTRV